MQYHCTRVHRIHQQAEQCCLELLYQIACCSHQTVAESDLLRKAERNVFPGTAPVSEACCSSGYQISEVSLSSPTKSMGSLSLCSLLLLPKIRLIMVPGHHFGFTQYLKCFRVTWVITVLWAAISSIKSSISVEDRSESYSIQS